MNGHSLIELAALLALLALAMHVVSPSVRGYRDRAEVLAARETLVGLIHEARAHAIREGSAIVRLDVDSARARIVVRDSVRRAESLGSSGPVRVELPGGRTSAEIPFNALGLGVFANETVWLEVGSARAGLVVSSYGRVRRQ
jgi:type II secretory pathway pseudopilin PulG